MTLLRPVLFCALLIPSAVHPDRLFLIAGQSNAVGQGSVAGRVTCDPGTAFEYDVLGDSSRPLRDPTGQPWGLLEASQGDGGSVAPAFAKRLAALSGDRIFVVMAARGGSSCARQGELGGYGTWDSAGSAAASKLLFPEAAAKTDLAVARTGLPLSGILWLQGERDANAILAGQETQAQYQAALTGVVRRFRKRYGSALPFFIVKTGYQYRRERPDSLDDTAGNVKVRQAQDAVAQDVPGVRMVYAGTHLFGQHKPTWMKDFVHYNQEGLNAIGDSAAIRVQAFLVGSATTIAPQSKHSTTQPRRYLRLDGRAWTW